MSLFSNVICELIDTFIPSWQEFKNPVAIDICVETGHETLVHHATAQTRHAGMQVGTLKQHLTDDGAVDTDL